MNEVIQQLDDEEFEIRELTEEELELIGGGNHKLVH
jgi:hypothetical protein